MLVYLRRTNCRRVQRFMFSQNGYALQDTKGLCLVNKSLETTSMSFSLMTLHVKNTSSWQPRSGASGNNHSALLNYFPCSWHELNRHRSYKYCIFHNILTSRWNVVWSLNAIYVRCCEILVFFLIQGSYLRRHYKIKYSDNFKGSLLFLHSVTFF